MRSAFILSLLLAAIAYAQPVSKLIIFGDSLSDNGNSYEYSHHQKPPKPLYYEGRYSDGLIWIDYVLKQLFEDNLHPPILNYAFGGAGVLYSKPQSFTLSQEIDSYLLTHHGTDLDSWFVIWIGSNDYFLHPDMTLTMSKKIVTEMSRNLSRLAQHDAHHIIVVAMPNLGLSPFAYDLELQSQLTAISSRHNHLLKETMQSLRTRFPKTDWHFVDINPLLTQIVTHPKQYGFLHTSECCLEPGPGLDKPNCAKFIFFDQLHPTTQVHKIFAQHFIRDLQFWDSTAVSTTSFRAKRESPDKSRRSFIASSSG